MKKIIILIIFFLFSIACKEAEKYEDYYIVEYKESSIIEIVSEEDIIDIIKNPTEDISIFHENEVIEIND